MGWGWPQAVGNLGLRVEEVDQRDKRHGTKGCPSGRSQQQEGVAPVGRLDAGVRRAVRGQPELWGPGQGPGRKWRGRLRRGRRGARCGR